MVKKNLTALGVIVVIFFVGLMIEESLGIWHEYRMKQIEAKNNGV